MHPSQFCIRRLILDLCNLRILRLDLHRFSSKLDFLELIDFHEFLVHRLRMRFCPTNLCTTLQLSISQVLLSTCLQDLIPLPLSQLASVLLLHVLVAKASSSVYGECSYQPLFAKQLLLRSKSLYAMRVVCSFRFQSANKALQTQSLTSSLSKCVVLTFCTTESNDVLCC